MCSLPIDYCIKVSWCGCGYSWDRFYFFVSCWNRNKVLLILWKNIENLNKHFCMEVLHLNLFVDYFYFYNFNLEIVRYVYNNYDCFHNVSFKKRYSCAHEICLDEWGLGVWCSRKSVAFKKHISPCSMPTVLYSSGAGKFVSVTSTGRSRAHLHAA